MLIGNIYIFIIVKYSIEFQAESEISIVNGTFFFHAGMPIVLLTHFYEFSQVFHVSIGIGVKIETVLMSHSDLIEIVLNTLSRKLSIVSKRCHIIVSCL